MKKTVNADARIRSILCYIDDNFESIINIEQIAQHFFLSKYHLCRLFKKETGGTLVSYLKKVRIRQACRMIENTDMSMSQIAGTCGFTSGSYFSKVFKAELGISPCHYKMERERNKRSFENTPPENALYGNKT